MAAFSKYKIQEFNFHFIYFPCQALEMEEENQDKDKWLLALNDRKRPYNSMYEIKGPTEEEMEAYYMKKRRDDDPMADFLKN